MENIRSYKATVPHQATRKSSLETVDGLMKAAAKVAEALWEEGRHPGSGMYDSGEGEGEVRS